MNTELTNAEKVQIVRKALRAMSLGSWGKHVLYHRNGSIAARVISDRKHVQNAGLRIYKLGRKASVYAGLRALGC